MSHLLPNIGKPAKNALKTIQVTTLEEVSQFSEDSFIKLHGVGPKAIRILKEAMEEVNLSFNTEIEVYPFESDFIVVGDLNCDNAPKRRMIRDFIIASYAPNLTFISSVVKEDIKYEVIGNRLLTGIEELSKYLERNQESLSSLTFANILTHGKDGAANGEVVLKSGEKIHFGIFVKFQSNRKDALIQEVTVYVKGDK